MLDKEDQEEKSAELTADGKKKFTPAETMRMLNINLQTSTDGNEAKDLNMTEAGDDEEEGLFADFRFRSFRQHKVI